MTLDGGEAEGGELGVGGREMYNYTEKKKRTGPQLEDGVARALGLCDPVSPGG